MPVDRKVMSKLQSEYGGEKGKHVYYAMENEGKVGPARRSGHSSAPEHRLDTVAHARASLRHSKRNASPEDHADLVSKVAERYPHLLSDRRK